MKNRKTILSILLVLILLGGLYGWFFVYNKSHPDYEQAEPDFVLTAAECYRSFSGAELQTAAFTGKVLEISGVPTAVETTDSLTVLVFVFDNGLFGEEGIRCTLLPHYAEKARRLETGKTVRIKGFCSGYNDTDVILEHCSIIEN